MLSSAHLPNVMDVLRRLTSKHEQTTHCLGTQLNILMCNTFSHIETSIKGKKNLLKIKKSYNEHHCNPIKHD